MGCRRDLAQSHLVRDRAQPSESFNESLGSVGPAHDPERRAAMDPDSRVDESVTRVQDPIRSPPTRLTIKPAHTENRTPSAPAHLAIKLLAHAAADTVGSRLVGLAKGLGMRCSGFARRALALTAGLSLTVSASSLADTRRPATTTISSCTTAAVLSAVAKGGSYVFACSGTIDVPNNGSTGDPFSVPVGDSVSLNANGKTV